MRCARSAPTASSSSEHDVLRNRVARRRAGAPERRGLVPAGGAGSPRRPPGDARARDRLDALSRRRDGPGRDPGARPPDARAGLARAVQQHLALVPPGSDPAPADHRRVLQRSHAGRRRRRAGTAPRSEAQPRECSPPSSSHAGWCCRSSPVERAEVTRTIVPSSSVSRSEPTLSSTTGRRVSAPCCGAGRSARVTASRYSSTTASSSSRRCLRAIVSPRSPSRSTFG